MATEDTKPRAAFPPDETGYDAWLRYSPAVGFAEDPRAAVLARVGDETKAHGCVIAAREEWEHGVTRLCGQPPRAKASATGPCTRLMIDRALPAEGYRLHLTTVDRVPELHIAGGDDAGVLYGVFAALQAITRQRWPDREPVVSAPRIPLRMLNHWDNPVVDPVLGSIERVSAGRTIFDWTDLGRPHPRYRDYARLLASVGINGACLNNVNATPEILASETLAGLATLATLLRAWNIRVYVSIDYASPVELGGLTTADPCDADVQAWWRRKVAEIYALIPDFGGFLVKADSEGRPGPGWYGRSHVEGAQPLAAALAPYGGTLFWRAFVYGRDVRAKAPSERAADDRATHAFWEFADLDGAFADNVVLQVKCAAMDFYPWEPVHALFGHLPQTRLALELDLAHQYTAMDIPLAWEGPYWSYVLNHDTGEETPPVTVADLLAGRGPQRKPGAIAGVANIRNTPNWFGHLLSGASLFTYGRMAWEPTLEPAEVSRAYAELMFGAKAAPVVARLLDDSLASCAQYLFPLGAGLWEHLHLVEPDPWNNERGAGITASGIGIDRTSDGSGYVDLYPPGVAAMLRDPQSCPSRWLLYFHHVRWDATMADGRTVVQRLYDDLHDAVETVRGYRAAWRSLHGKVDLARWAHVYDRLARAVDHAELWRDLLCRFLHEDVGIPDARSRHDPRNDATHTRLRGGFPQAVEDYRARVQRRRTRVAALTDEPRSVERVRDREPKSSTR